MTTSTTENEQTAQAAAVANEKQEPPKKANARAQKPRVAPSKGKSGKKATPAKKGTKAPKKATLAKAEGVREGSKTEKGSGSAETLGRCYPRGDHESDWLAATQRTRFHFRHPGQEDGAQSGIGQRRGRRAHLQHREVASLRTCSWPARLRPRRAFLFS